MISSPLRNLFAGNEPAQDLAPCNPRSPDFLSAAAMILRASSSVTMTSPSVDAMQRVATGIQKI
jgi:hypothetical protein